MTIFCDSWSSSKLSTEATVRGSAKRGCRSHFSSMSTVCSRDVWHRNGEHENRSPFDFLPRRDCGDQSQWFWYFSAPGEWDIEVNGRKCWLSSVEIKTKFDHSMLSIAVQLTSTDLIFCHFVDDVCHLYILQGQLSQMIAQARVLNEILLTYVVETETGV